jgi:hypothetical protein
MRAMVEKVRPLLPPHPKVIEFGNQRYTAGRDFPSTEAFYKSLGFNYLALDVNEAMGAVICDLNVTGHPHRGELITNNGTSEHIFNQASCFQNAHEMCKTDGIMLHILPFTPWLNHGFYNYNPILFRDLAAANDYEMVFTAIANRSRDWVELGEWGFIEKRPEQLTQTAVRLLPGGEVFVVSVLRKKKDAPFAAPFQGKYKKDIADGKLQQTYVAR